MEKLKIKKITRFKKSAFNDLNLLWQQLSLHGYQMTESHFKKVLKSKNTHLFGLYDKNKIIGTITVTDMCRMRVYRGFIEDFVVDKNYRGKGLGKKLMDYAINFAKKLGIKSLNLTSEPERELPNIIYKKTGFKIQKTNYYRMQI